jgi:DNA-binding MarR family transcriptional regulator
LDIQTLDAFATEARTLVDILARTSWQALDRRLSKAEPRISGLQYLILQALDAGQKTLSELSHIFGRAPSTLVPAIDGLEDKSLLTRGQDPSDRRRTPLSLTKQGRQLIIEVPYVHESDPLVQGLQAMEEEPVERMLALLCMWLTRLPGGQELARQVETELQIHVQATRKEGTQERTSRETVCQYCWAPDGFEPCPRRSTTHG